MPEKSSAKITAHPATVETIDGPVPDDHPSHALRLAAAEDLVDRCKRQLATAEAELARIRAERKKGK
jgi:hypothetical protein